MQSSKKIKLTFHPGALKEWYSWALVNLDPLENKWLLFITLRMMLFSYRTSIVQVNVTRNIF